MKAPLDGVVVLDLTRFLSGPHATLLLGVGEEELAKLKRQGIA